ATAMAEALRMLHPSPGRRDAAPAQIIPLGNRDAKHSGRLDPRYSGICTSNGAGMLAAGDGRLEGVDLRWREDLHLPAAASPANPDPLRRPAPAFPVIPDRSGDADHLGGFLDRHGRLTVDRRPPALL